MGGVGSGRAHFYRKQSAEQKAAICQKVIDYMGSGQIVETVARNLGCCRRTFFEALQEFPELHEAYERGRTAFVAWFDQLFKASMMGMKIQDESSGQEIKINPTMAIFYAKVHCGWKEADEHTVHVSGGVNLNYQSLARLEKNLEIFKRNEVERIRAGELGTVERVDDSQES
jgi:hypothetical protein